MAHLAGAGTRVIIDIGCRIVRPSSRSAAIAHGLAISLLGGCRSVTAMCAVRLALSQVADMHRDLDVFAVF